MVTIAALIWVVAVFIFALIKEQPSRIQSKQSVWSEFRNGILLYKRNRWFRRYTMTRILFLSVGQALPFYSMHAAPVGGETPIADSRIIYQQMDPGIKKRFEQKKVMYVRNYRELDLSWREVFQTDSKAGVEAYCRQAGIEFAGHDDAPAGIRTSGGLEGGSHVVENPTAQIAPSGGECGIAVIGRGDEQAHCHLVSVEFASDLILPRRVATTFKSF